MVSLQAATPHPAVISISRNLPDACVDAGTDWCTGCSADALCVLCAAFPTPGSHNSCSKGSKNCLSTMFHGKGCAAKPTESHHLLAGKCVRAWDIGKGKADDNMLKATCFANGTVAVAEYGNANDCSGKFKVHMFAPNSCSKNVPVSTAGCASQGANSGWKNTTYNSCKKGGSKCLTVEFFQGNAPGRTTQRAREGRGDRGGLPSE